MANCVICNNNAQIDNTNIHELKIICSSCGSFSITDVALNLIQINQYPNWRAKLQEWIRLRQDVLVTEGIIKSIF